LPSQPRTGPAASQLAPRGKTRSVRRLGHWPNRKVARLKPLPRPGGANSVCVQPLRGALSPGRTESNVKGGWPWPPTGCPGDALPPATGIWLVGTCTRQSEVRMSFVARGQPPAPGHGEGVEGTQFSERTPPMDLLPRLSTLDLELLVVIAIPVAVLASDFSSGPPPVPLVPRGRGWPARCQCCQNSSAKLALAAQPLPTTRFGRFPPSGLRPRTAKRPTRLRRATNAVVSSCCRTSEQANLPAEVGTIPELNTAPGTWAAPRPATAFPV